MPYGFAGDPSQSSVPIWPVKAKNFEDWLTRQPGHTASWVRISAFQAKPGQVLVVPDGVGAIAGVVLGGGDEPSLYAFAGLPGSLPAATYRIEAVLDDGEADLAALGWALGSYRFERYKKADNGSLAELILPERCGRTLVERAAASVFLVRDLVNTPAGDLGPAELAKAAHDLAVAYGAEIAITVGEALLAANYPMIHAVGRGSAREPRLIDFSWGEASAPKVTLVGKGVCFDSGGLDIKPSSGMRLMKKDMGGAATVLGLARMIMDAGLPVRLRVLIPAVENSVSGHAFRPGDVLTSRKGLTVEIGNTDAEGRLVLADALAEADAEEPDLLIDCATLTGAARVALGPEVMPFYTDDDDLAAALAGHSKAQHDPLWRMPLWAPYGDMIKSSIADLDNAGKGGFAGSVTAALFLKAFVEKARSYVHFDLFAWNPKTQPGRPEGGEAQAMRALYALLADRYPFK